jgi:hypothetical protein
MLVLVVSKMRQWLLPPGCAAMKGCLGVREAAYTFNHPGQRGSLATMESFRVGCSPQTGSHRITANAGGWKQWSGTRPACAARGWVIACRLLVVRKGPPVLSAHRGADCSAKNVRLLALQRQ